MAEDHIHGLFSFACCAHDETLVVAQHLQPVLNIRGVVAEAMIGFKPAVVQQRSASDLRYPKGAKPMLMPL